MRVQIEVIRQTTTWQRTPGMSEDAGWVAAFVLSGTARLPAPHPELGPCQATVLPPRELAWVTFHADMALLVRGLAGPPWEDLAAREMILAPSAAAVLETVFFAHQRLPEHQAAALLLVGHELLDNEEHAAAKPPPARKVDFMPRDLVGTVTAYLAAHLSEPLTMPQLESVFGCSRHRLLAAFRKAGRPTPAKTLTAMRIARARELLLRNESTIAQVGAAVGYPDPATFSRVFKKHTGQSPRTFSGEARWLL